MNQLLQLYTGRMNREKFFYGCIVIVILDIIFFREVSADLNPILIVLAVLQGLFGSVIATKRLHDFGFSGWPSLFLLLPVIHFFVGLALLFTPGDDKANKYGPVPK